MKNIVKNKANIWLKKYKYNTILTLIIFILFLIAGYSNQNIKYKLYVDSSETSLAYGIYTENNEQYIHIEDLTSIFKDNIYHDKISGKIIITTHDTLKKINKSDERYVIKREDNTYINLDIIKDNLDRSIVVSNEKIYISRNDYIEAVVLNDRTEIYDKNTHDIITFIQKGDKVKISIDESVKSKNTKTVNVITTKNDKSYYGYVLKDNLQYEYIQVDNEQYNNKVVLVKVSNKLNSNTDIKYVDMIAIDMYRLSGVNVLAQLEYINNVPDNIELYATVNNGQSSSNYDPDITTRMLNSESNREKVIQTILNNVRQLDGVCIDFSSLKVADKENFTQFIKELAAVLHANNKKIIVNIPGVQYIDVEAVAIAADYVVLQPYMARTVNSKTSGPISSITYVQNVIQSMLEQDINMQKIVLEIPAYSILWTERKGTVINAEKYTMKMMQEYISANNIQISIDKGANQNYINYTKGITTYKMWLEDEYSVVKKTELAARYNLAGISVYRSGMELKEIYNSISNALNK